MYTTAFTTEIATQHIQDLHREAGARRLAKLSRAGHHPDPPGAHGPQGPQGPVLADHQALARRLRALTL